MTKNNKDKQILAEQTSGQGYDDEVAFGCCPQYVLKAVQSAVGYVTDETIETSHGLSGDGGLMSLGACGALTGGLVALSAKRDHNKHEKGTFVGNFRLDQELVTRFVQEFGGVTCQKLQQKFTGQTYNMWDEAQYKAFTDARGSKCADAIAMVSQWVMEMLQDETSHEAV